MIPPVARVTTATVRMAGCSRHIRNPYTRVRLTQMTRKGTVDQAPISRIPSRFTPTNTAHTMSTHDDRAQRSPRLSHLPRASRRGRVIPPRPLAASAIPMPGPPLIPDTALLPPAARHQVTPDVDLPTVGASGRRDQEPARR